MLVVYIALCLCYRVSGQLQVPNELIDDFDTEDEPKYWLNWNKADDAQHWYHSFHGDPTPLGRRGDRPPSNGALVDGFLEVVPVDDLMHSGDPAHLHSKYLTLEPGSSLEINYWMSVPVDVYPFDLAQMKVQLYDRGHSLIYKFPPPESHDRTWHTVVIPLEINVTSNVQVNQLITIS